MRDFSFDQASRVLEDPSLVRSLAALYEHKGKQALYLEARPDVLDSLCEFAKIQSTDASNRIEGEINRTKDTYYDALQQSSARWNEGENDYAPFARYTLGVVLAAYKDFESRIEGTIGAGMSKPERIEKVLANSIGKVTKTDIVRECPDISLTTIERTLHDLLTQDKLQKVGAGRSTGYVWKGYRVVARSIDVCEQLRMRSEAPLGDLAIRRIVIWHDADGSFADEFDRFSVSGFDGVRIMVGH